MYVLYLVCGVALMVSFIADRKKTLKALKIAVMRFVNILPAFLIMFIFISVVLFLVPDSLISYYLGGDNRFLAMIFAFLIGSITIMPGFIAFPLSGIMLKKGVPYMVISAFTTSLMMVGVLSFPLERHYFGTKLTIIRNLISLVIAFIVAIITGMFFGEVF